MRILPLALTLSLAPATTFARDDRAPIDPSHLEFFEKRIRPVLVDKCYKCHSADAEKLKGGLLLDSRWGWQQGGESGPAIVPGDPSTSLLLSALHYDKFEMPPKAKLPAGVIADFEQWIGMGAPDPRTEKKTHRPDEAQSFDLEKRKNWWSLQPVAKTTPPAVADTAWPRTPHDSFILATLEQKNWQPAPPAARTSWLRRVTYDLTGLPPKPNEIDAFLADRSPHALENVVDRLLASPHFGEQWARHWMDLVRYAETKAFEADYPMPNVYRYRDYLIRAFNADIPYDQLLKEAIAGDLLEPRLDPGTGNNESVIGPGYLYLTDGQHGPPDIHADEARIFDDMIDVVGKAFLGQTLACARCHDHKFDAITAGDYYSLYGIIASSRIDYADINPPAQQDGWQQKLAAAKTKVRHALADVLAGDLAKLQLPPDTPPRPATPAPGSVGGLTRDSFGGWTPSGRAFGDTPRPPGDFIVPVEGDSAIASFVSARPASGALASRFAGSLKSPDFKIAGDSVSVRVKGKNARINLYVRHYELIGRGPTTNGTTKIINSDGWVEHRFDTRLWVGETAYLELQQNGSQMGFKWSTDDHKDGSYAAIDAATNNTPLPPLPPTSATGLGPIPAAWRENRLTVAQGDLLQHFHEAGTLDFNVGRSSALKQAVDHFRKLQAEVPEPTYVRTLSDGPGHDEPVYIRGSHKNLSAAPNPRRFLDGIDPTPFDTPGSGRRQWAEALASPENPLTARVITNRIWHHLFGRGIVASVDDLGQMGDQPSHPGLLDFLATGFIADGWSVKTLIRDLVLSSTYRMSSTASTGAVSADPDNIYLQHMPVRRLQAEAVRDTILAVSGQLNPTLFGPSQGGDGGNRRSVYIQLKRRFMPEFLMTFDMPNATETFGRRNITASPTQSLAMMNSNLVWSAAEKWASDTVNAPAESFSDRVDLLHRQAFGRAATTRELDWARSFLDDHELDEKSATNHRGLFKEFCHAMLNRKELIYVY